MKQLLFIPLVVFLASCSASVNPREGGLAGGVRAIHTGAYKKQRKERETKLATLNATNRALLEESRRLDRQLADSKKVEQSESQKAASINHSINSLSHQISSLTRRQSGNKKQLVVRKQKLTSMRREVKALSEKQRRAKINSASVNRDLIRKIEQLNKELDLLANSI